MPDTEITLSIIGRLNSAAVGGIADRFQAAASQCRPAVVNLDLSRLNFVEPSGVTFLSNFLRWLNKRGMRVVLMGCDINRAAIRYLDDSGFFLQHAGGRLRSGASCRSTTMPLCGIESEQAHHWIRTQMIPWMTATLQRSGSTLLPLQTSLSEIFNNIKDHSRERIGSVYGQHFPNLHELRVCIADFGRGIPDSVRSVSPNLDDNACIIQAVERGFTTRSTRNNAGEGLDYLLESVVGTMGSVIEIHSSNGHVLFHNVNGRVTPHLLTNSGFCPGTTIDIKLLTKTIMDEVDEAEDLTW